MTCIIKYIIAGGFSMEIKNYLNAVNAYNKTKFERSKTSAVSSISAVKNTDKVEFSSGKINSIQGLKDAIAQKVENSASPERIAELTASINNGQYNVQAELVARSILE
jgi:anti-sigma28 factor (negative regulator of flagellin synthesis)